MKIPAACLRVIKPSATESTSFGARARQIAGMDWRGGSGTERGGVVLSVKAVISASMVRLRLVRSGPVLAKRKGPS